MCAPCADHTPCPVREDVRRDHPLPRYEVYHYKEAATNADEYPRSRHKAANSDPSPQQVKLSDGIGKYVVRNT